MKTKPTWQDHINFPWDTNELQAELKVMAIINRNQFLDAAKELFKHPKFIQNFEHDFWIFDDSTHISVEEAIDDFVRYIGMSLYPKCATGNNMYLPNPNYKKLRKRQSANSDTASNYRRREPPVLCKPMQYRRMQ